MKILVLETERLILRPVALSDAPNVQKYFNNWNIIKNLATVVPWPYPNDGAEDFIRNVCLPGMDKGEMLVWAITLKPGSEAVGLIHFRTQITNGGQRGFWLAEHLHGQGLMTEAVTAVQDYLFFDCGMEKILVSNAINNPESRRVKEKTGGVFLRHADVAHHSGENKSELWEITRENWAKIRGRSV